MPAETLNCPMCGAAAASDSSKCEHCGARLATVACPACFGMIFEGAKFCSHCGAKVEREEEVETGKPLNCPRCKIVMEAVVVGKTSLRECTKCEGLWLDAAAFQEVCEDREKQAAVLGMVTSTQPGEAGDWENVRYLPCPICNGLMNRVQFAKCSHVIVDVCKSHGTWFDKDELRRIVEFIRAGGIEKSRAEEMDELERKRSEAGAAQIASAYEPASYSTPARYDGVNLAIDAISMAAGFLFKL